MRPVTVILAVMTAASLAVAQLLPPKPAETVKIDRALVFTVDYDTAAATDSSSTKLDSSIKEGPEKGDYLKNAFIWAGFCITGAALSSAFGGHGPIDCSARD